jgi:hypothetical protein
MMTTMKKKMSVRILALNIVFYLRPHRRASCEEILLKRKRIALYNTMTYALRRMMLVCLIRVPFTANNPAL